LEAPFVNFIKLSILYSIGAQVLIHMKIRPCILQMHDRRIEMLLNFHYAQM
jgi:hypothetical protein